MSCNLLITKNFGSYVCDVVADYDGLHRVLNMESFDFGDEEANKAYVKRFEDEELMCFGVIKKEECKCCGSFKEVDSLWGIDAESPEQALDVYQESYGYES